MCFGVGTVNNKTQTKGKGFDFATVLSLFSHVAYR